MNHDRFRDDWEEAKRNYEEIGEERYDNVQIVEAQAKTGSRYTVVAVKLGDRAQIALGGDTLISVVYPKAAVYSLAHSYIAVLDDGYLAGKFCRELQHGGDQYAVIETIRRAVRYLYEE